MAFRLTMPARDPQRAESEPQHVREYAASTGGYTSNPNNRPVPGTPQDSSKGGK